MYFNKAPQPIACIVKHSSKMENIHLMILSFKTNRSGQTSHTQIRRLSEGQSDQGLQDALLSGRATVFKC